MLKSVVLERKFTKKKMTSLNIVKTHVQSEKWFLAEIGTECCSNIKADLSGII